MARAIRMELAMFSLSTNKTIIYDFESNKSVETVILCLANALGHAWIRINFILIGKRLKTSIAVHMAHTISARAAEISRWGQDVERTNELILLGDMTRRFG